MNELQTLLSKLDQKIIKYFLRNPYKSVEQVANELDVDVNYIKPWHLITVINEYAQGERGE